MKKRNTSGGGNSADDNEESDDELHSKINTETKSRLLGSKSPVTVIGQQKREDSSTSRAKPTLEQNPRQIQERDSQIKSPTSNINRNFVPLSKYPVNSNTFCSFSLLQFCILLRILPRTLLGVPPNVLVGCLQRLHHRFAACCHRA